MIKYLFYDLETTGVSYIRNGVHQLAGIYVEDRKVIDTINLNIQPHPKCEIEDEALKVSGVAREDLATYIPMEKAYLTFLHFLGRYVNKFDKKDKIYLVGFNNRGFDDKFLRRFFEYNGDQYFGSWFWADSLDVMVLAAYALRSVRTQMENFKLETVAAKCGVPFDPAKAHDALYDVGVTMKIFNLIPLL